MQRTIEFYFKEKISTSRTKNTKENEIHRLSPNSIKSEKLDNKNTVETITIDDNSNDSLTSEFLTPFECTMDKNDMNSIGINTKPSSCKKFKRALSPTDYHNSSEKKSKIDCLVKYDRKEKTSESYNPSTPKKSFQVKIPSPKSCSPSKNDNIRHEKLYLQENNRELITEELIIDVIENLNLANEGAIRENKFNLEKIYSEKCFSLYYNEINTSISTKYELSEVSKPNDFAAGHIFSMICDVFANSLNCAYFDQYELDCIFSILSMSSRAQMLFARMIKRKWKWYQIKKLEYSEISNDLVPIFRELHSRAFCVLDIDNEEITTLLNLLQVSDARKICQHFKLKHTEKKECLIAELKKYSLRKSYFTSAKSPKSVLCSEIKKILGPCIKLSDRIVSIFKKIVTLFIPCSDPSETLQDMFFMLMKVQQGKLIFPVQPKTQFPLFCDKNHLENYMEARDALNQCILATEKKDWVCVKKLGDIAYERLQYYSKTEESFYSFNILNLPGYIKRYIPEYVWGKVVWNSIIALKKDNETVEKAIEYLTTLLNQENYLFKFKGIYYAELALLYMHHVKNLESSAKITIEALKRETEMTVVDKLEMLYRSKKLLKRKSGITETTRTSLQTEYERIIHRLPVTFDYVVNNITGIMQRNKGAGKSIWKINSNQENISYGSVELLVMHHYKENGYPNALHCEGSLPVSLFAILFFEEIYHIPIPGVFVCKYQQKPLDLYNEEFYENRKDRIDMKLDILRKLDLESFCGVIENNFLNYNKFESLIKVDLFSTPQTLKDIVLCLQQEAILGICERLIKEFRLWRSGFPDLIVWNASDRKCKIVEVKGPNDTLSIKQELWIRYLLQLGIEVEVCRVENCKSEVNLK